MIEDATVAGDHTLTIGLPEGPGLLRAAAGLDAEAEGDQKGEEEADGGAGALTDAGAAEP